ncbi:colicin E3/pyocin S6 family cytotoxin [Streptomyces hirsutus]|uniref:colicin E3/pyocin S6 family cytotoxin n=1 Tax=Streptomyces hirsutus TaxID=35620 RepID=UPI0033D74110
MKGPQESQGETKANGKTGKSKRCYEWDYMHGDVEAYGGRGGHLGSADTMGGKIYKPGVKGRKIRP